MKVIIYNAHETKFHILEYKRIVSLPFIWAILKAKQTNFKNQVSTNPKLYVLQLSN